MRHGRTGGSSMSRYLGKLQVKTVREGDGEMPMQAALPGVAGADLAELQPWYWSKELALQPEAAMFHIEVRSYVLQADGLNVLIDTCCGNDKQRSVAWADRLQTEWPLNLARAGFEPADIHLVLCTHLHADHVGWNTRLENGRWVPTFPNARYVFSRRDFEFFGRQTREAHNREAYIDSVLPVVEAGLADIVESNHCVHREIEDGIWLEDAAGHSPGNVVVNARRGGSRVVFTGDVIHHPIQLVRPDIAFFADESPAEACATRQRLLAQCADDGAVLLPAHFPDPPAGRVRRAKRNYRYDFLELPSA
jgi:glyoxylase-like metal-dependent hydrolase (beta-lactamase superfamily II)